MAYLEQLQTVGVITRPGLALGTPAHSNARAKDFEALPKSCNFHKFLRGLLNLTSVHPLWISVTESEQAVSLLAPLPNFEKSNLLKTEIQIAKQR